MKIVKKTMTLDPEQIDTLQKEMSEYYDQETAVTGGSIRRFILDWIQDKNQNEGETYSGSPFVW